MLKMALFDFEKTTIKLPFALTITLGVLALAGAGWRFESKMSDFESKLESLEEKILYKTTIEFMKVNNRIDLMEAKKFVMRYNFKRHKKNEDFYKFAYRTRTDNKKENNKRHPQFCMILPSHPEFRRYKVDIKKLKDLA